MSTCREFRDELERALEGRAQPKRLVPLAWDEHLLSCVACRELLEAEHALEVLLATLPDPRLPDELALRVLSRLRRERAQAEGHIADLDALLEEAPAPVAPESLASRVLAGLEPQRRQQREEAQLDAWLDRVPAPSAPEGLAADVLAALRAESSGPVARVRWNARLWIPLAAAVIAAVLWFARGRQDSARPDGRDRAVGSSLAGKVELDDEMVAAFDVLENWDHLTGEDVDLLLASIDELDELLFEASEWESEPEDEPEGNAGG